MVKTLDKRIQAFTGTSEPVVPAEETEPLTSSKQELDKPALSTSPATSVGIKASHQPDCHLSDSYQALGTSFMDILTSTSLITDNAPHLTPTNHVTDFER